MRDGTYSHVIPSTTLPVSSYSHRFLLINHYELLPSHDFTRITESTVERHEASLERTPNTSRAGNLDDLPITSPKIYFDKRGGT